VRRAKTVLRKIRVVLEVEHPTVLLRGDHGGRFVDQLAGHRIPGDAPRGVGGERLHESDGFAHDGVILPVVKAMRDGLSALLEPVKAMRDGFDEVLEHMKAVRDGFHAMSETIKATRDGFCSVETIMKAIDDGFTM
jgi:hypothetical protein